MYKNVANQHIVGVILLFSSCLLTVTAKARPANENSPINYANTDLRSAKKISPQPNPQLLQKLLKAILPGNPSNGYAFGLSFTFSANKIRRAYYEKSID